MYTEILNNVSVLLTAFVGLVAAVLGFLAERLRHRYHDKHSTMEMPFKSHRSERLLADVLSDCRAGLSEGPQEAVKIDAIVKRFVESGTEEVPRAYWAGGVHAIVALLILIGALEREGDEVRPPSSFASAFLGSLKAHLQNDRRFFPGWNAPGSELDGIWLRDILKTVEESRVRAIGPQAIPAREVLAVIVLIKATRDDGSHVYLMEHNRLWYGGMWWFPGCILGSAERGDPNVAIRNELKETIGVWEPDQYTIGRPLLQDLEDRKISERLGAFTSYRFSVIPATIRPEGAQLREAKKIQFNYHERSKRHPTRTLRWLTWEEIRKDHPLSYHSPHILDRIEQVLGKIDISPLTVASTRSTRRQHRNQPPFHALIVDAGGVLFREDFWLDKLRRRFSRYKQALPPQEIGLPELHFSALSIVLSAIVHPTPGLRMKDVLQRVYEVYNADWPPRDQGSAKGILLPGVRETLERVRDLGVKSYVLTNASMSGEDFLKVYGEKLQDSQGGLLIERCLTSRDIGATKTNPLTYERLLAELDFREDQVLMVAHDLDEILGAKLAGGITVAAVNVHYSEEQIAQEFADYFLERFEELGPLLES